MESFLQVAREAALKAGEFLRGNFGEATDVRYKDREHKNPTSAIDKGAETIILTTLKASFPNHSFISEELGRDGKPSDYTWFIDPLDGTVNYIHGYRNFGVSIALSYQKGIILGLIYNPLTRELFSAIRGKGAYLNEREIHVSAISKLNESLIAISFPYSHHYEAFNKSLAYFARLSRDSQALRRDGSTALSLCNVACGRCDGFLVTHNELWDYSAGTIIVSEAGGKVTGFNGQPFELDTREVLASNGIIHEALLSLLAE